MIFTIALSLLMISCSIDDNHIIYVNAKSPAGGDGLSWQTAHNNLQDALDEAAKGDELWVASGTYKPSSKVSGDSDRNKSFQLKNGVTLYGGFRGSEESLDQRDWHAHKTILSGDLNSDDRGY